MESVCDSCSFNEFRKMVKDNSGNKCIVSDLTNIAGHCKVGYPRQPKTAIATRNMIRSSGLGSVCPHTRIKFSSK